ncbi:CDK5 and ABL1 enzyme substrate 1, partial [Cichlidogyrus casuarinus]
MHSKSQSPSLETAHNNSKTYPSSCHFLKTGFLNSRCPYGHFITSSDIAITPDAVFTESSNHYDPYLLDDPRKLFAAHKRSVHFPLLLTSVLMYTKFADHKRNINHQFHESFPAVELTLTKLRSLKRQLLDIVDKLNLDIWIYAHAAVLLEKLILKLYVNRSNRKSCTAACLLVSAKLNDIKGTDMNTLFN